MEPTRIAPRVLLIKTSSMGDLVHTLSALQEAQDLVPGLSIDWVCEESFVDIPPLINAVDRVIVVAMRRWKKNLFSFSTGREIGRFLQALRERHYDLVIDAQGLLKSSWIAMAARADARWGFDWSSAREPLAALMVGHRVCAPSQWHAIERLRTLLSSALGYAPRSAISWIESFPAPSDSKKILFLHGTSRVTKAWPEGHWIELGVALVQKGYQVLLPHGSSQERQQALRIAQGIDGGSGVGAQVLTAMTLAQMIDLFRQTAGAVGVDSGLMHLAVALGRPTVAVMCASHLPQYCASRFAPSWAPHAQVVQREANGQEISVGAVLTAWESSRT